MAELMFLPPSLPRPVCTLPDKHARLVPPPLTNQDAAIYPSFWSLTRLVVLAPLPPFSNPEELGITRSFPLASASDELLGAGPSQQLACFGSDPIHPLSCEKSPF